MNNHNKTETRVIDTENKQVDARGEEEDVGEK